MRRLSLFAVGLLCVTGWGFGADKQDAPLAPREAPGAMTLPPGFSVTLFAGEPDVVQPIAFTFDDRGRLWVVECVTYPNWIKDSKAPGKDRIVILEDTDGDGTFDKRTVFADNLVNATSVEIGFGGVWVLSLPHLVFIPDRDGDDKPDGPPEVMLDGFSLEAKHNVASCLTWGPDGWLYGCHGITDTSKLGTPGTPAEKRAVINCGVWRYHPTKKLTEAVAHGTTNPWGLDFDDYGEMFITNCVIHHLWHVVPGAHFQRMYGQDLNPHCYGLINSVADHIHWAGGSWTSSRGGQGAHSDAGGGHAHAGAMVYLGDNFPDRYRNGVFTCNIHGNRVNHDILERQGSSYVARHGKDFLFANDPWFRGLVVKYGPDGGVYVSDWCDTGECHNYVVAHTSSGRIYKVVHGKPAPWKGDLKKLSDEELVKLQQHKNDWFVRHARRLLQERAAAGKLKEETVASLEKMITAGDDPTRQLRGLWALHTVAKLDEKRILETLGHADEHLRAWAVRLSAELPEASPALHTKLVEMAKKDPSPKVRVALCSRLQKLPIDQRLPIAEELALHGEDAADAYLPLMLWYGIEPAVAAKWDWGHRMLTKARIPLVREYTARRLLTAGEREGLDAVTATLLEIDNPAVERDLLRGMAEALVGRREVATPRGWEKVSARLDDSPLPEVRERSRTLAVQFGDKRVIEGLRHIVMEPRNAPAARKAALETLMIRQSADLLPLVHSLLTDPAMRAAALKALVAYNDAKTPEMIARDYASWPDEDKREAIQTLISRPAYALALVDALNDGKIPKKDVNEFHVRQMLAMKNDKLTQGLAAAWGTFRPVSKDKAKEMADYKKELSADALKAANPSKGRLVYTKSCGLCHRLFDDGTDIGPNLTGSQRANLDYVLENVLDPSAVVANEYKVHVIEMKNGRVITGFVKREDGAVLTLATLKDEVTVQKADIESRVKTEQSLMPEGLFQQLTKEEVRDLVAYLASPTQVPLPKPR